MPTWEANQSLHVTWKPGMIATGMVFAPVLAVDALRRLRRLRGKLLGEMGEGEESFSERGVGEEGGRVVMWVWSWALRVW